MLHLILPKLTSCHHFQPLPHDVDKKIFRTFGWSSDFDVETASIVVAVQPPFTLSPQDFKSMSRVVEVCYAPFLDERTANMVAHAA